MQPVNHTENVDGKADALLVGDIYKLSQKMVRLREEESLIRYSVLNVFMAFQKTKQQQSEVSYQIHTHTLLQLKKYTVYIWFLKIQGLI